MVTYCRGCFIADGGQTLAPAPDTRAPTLLADLLPEFKAHARIDWADDDALCEFYLQAAASRIEQFTLVPVMPVAFAWTVTHPASHCQAIELPLLNCALPGEQFGFELLIAPKRVPMPAAWPLILEVGFATGEAMPADMKATLFALALALYEFRSSPEMQEVHSRSVIAMGLARYWSPRV
jgi:hypothetical protein